MGLGLASLARYEGRNSRQGADQLSNSDSFIDEVNDEVRRDKLYGLLRRYGWIAVIAVVALVGGAAYIEYSKSQERARAQALGDGMLAAMGNPDRAARAGDLQAITLSTPASAAVVGLLTAAEQVSADADAAAIETLETLAMDGDVPELYRQIAQFKALTLEGADADPAARRQALEAMAQPGNPLRLLAAEQLALINIQDGDPAAAIAAYQAILSDAEVTADLQQRALQVIVALGGEPVMNGTAAPGDETLPASDN